MSLISYREQLEKLQKQLTQQLPADKLAVFGRDAAGLALSYPQPLKLQAGDKAPDFSLPDVDGQQVQLSQVLARGPVVLVFYRGVWCPYCNLALRTYQAALAEIKAAGGDLIAVSPTTPDHSLEAVSANELGFHVLSDVGNEVAALYTTVISNPDTSTQAMAELGFDFFSFYADRSGKIPVPAAFVIASDGTIVFAEAKDGDYRNRTEASALLAAVTDAHTVNNL